MNGLYGKLMSNRLFVRLRPRQRLEYLHRFGVVEGVRLFRQISLTTGRTTVRLPGSHLPFQLRAHTSDAPTFEQVFVLREYDFPYPNADPRLIIDAGANIGCAAVYFAQRYPAARILAIEPEDQNFALLVQNTAAYPNVTPIRAALWTKKVPLGITNPGTASYGFQIGEADPRLAGPVDAVTIPELLALSESNHIDILKIDIEGSEDELFRAGYEAWLDRVGVIIVEVHEDLHAGITARINALLQGYAFAAARIGENLVFIR